MIILQGARNCSTGTEVAVSMATKCTRAAQGRTQGDVVKGSLNRGTAEVRLASNYVMPDRGAKH
jgi:hypothetical protein